MHSGQLVFRLTMVLAACGGSWVFAQDTAESLPGFAVPVAQEQLDSYRGGFDLVKNDAQLSATVANNAAVNVLSGNNSIADGSFANASGLPMVIQNSGSNVLIQNATIVNLQLQ